MDHSGISGNGGQQYPFKIPVIVKARTSDMHIEYQYPVSKKAQNLATLEGEFYEPYLYKKLLFPVLISNCDMVAKNRRT